MTRTQPNEWVPLREFMELRVRLAEHQTEAAESRSEIKFAQVAHSDEISRMLNEAKFKEHNTALEQNNKLAATAAVAQEKQAAEFARKATMDAELRALSDRINENRARSVASIEEVRLMQTGALQESLGRSKGSEPLQRIGMLIVGAIIVATVTGVLGMLFAVFKLGGKG